MKWYKEGRGWELIGGNYVDFTFEYYCPTNVWDLPRRERYYQLSWAPIRNKVYATSIIP